MNAMHSRFTVHQAQRAEDQADGANEDVVLDTGPTRQVSERRGTHKAKILEVCTPQMSRIDLSVKTESSRSLTDSCAHLMCQADSSH